MTKKFMINGDEIEARNMEEAIYEWLDIYSTQDLRYPLEINGKIVYFSLVIDEVIDKEVV